MTINLPASDSHDQGGTPCALRHAWGAQSAQTAATTAPDPSLWNACFRPVINEPLTLDRFFAYVSEPVSRHLPGITSS